MNASAFSQFKALSFDCYGTLIDWECGIWDAMQPLLAANPQTTVGRQQLLSQYGKDESALEQRHPGLPYPQVLAGVHHAVAGALGLQTTAQLDADFGASLPHWPAFPDTAEALRKLATRYKLVILSNVHRDGFAASNRKLGVRFDAVYTAEQIGSYKPDAANFQFMLQHLKADHDIEASGLLHVAQSLFHDHVPARAAGLANAWIDRQGLAGGGSWGATAQVTQRPEVTFTFPSLMALAQAATSTSG